MNEKKYRVDFFDKTGEKYHVCEYFDSLEEAYSRARMLQRHGQKSIFLLELMRVSAALGREVYEVVAAF